METDSLFVIKGRNWQVKILIQHMNQ